MKLSYYKWLEASGTSAQNPESAFIEFIYKTPEPPAEDFVPETGLGSLPKFYKRNFYELFDGLRSRLSGVWVVPFASPEGSCISFEEGKCPVCSAYERIRERNAGTLSRPEDEDDDYFPEDGPGRPNEIAKWVNPLKDKALQSPYYEPNAYLKVPRFSNGHSEYVTVTATGTMVDFINGFTNYARKKYGKRLETYRYLYERSPFTTRRDTVFSVYPAYVHGYRVFHYGLWGSCFICEPGLISIFDSDSMRSMGFSLPTIPFTWERWENGGWPGDTDCGHHELCAEDLEGP